MKITVENKEYTLKFGLKPTLKTHLITKVAKAESQETENDLELVEKVLEIIPEMLLVGLQVNHFDEFGFDYDNEDEKNAKLDLAYNLLEKYLGEGNDFAELYQEMEEDLLKNSFLSGLFNKEMSEQTKKTKKSSTSKTEN